LAQQNGTKERGLLTNVASSSYNPASDESEPQNTQISPVNIVPVPKRKVEQRRVTIGEGLQIVTSFKSQLDKSLKDK
jgi:hypothetical protein